MDPKIYTIDRDILEGGPDAQQEVSSIREAGSVFVPLNHRGIARTPRRPARTRTQTAPLEELELNRIFTYRLQHNSQNQWLPLGAWKPYPPSLPDAEEYVVELVGSNDPLHPHSWALSKKLYFSVILTYSTFVASFASAIFSSTTPIISHHFHISEEVGILGITLYVLGFAAGPTIWAPMSELSGRRWPLILGMFGFSLFTVPTATAKDTQTLMLCRFFSGILFTDMYDNATRGIAISIFAMAVFVGPFATPFTGGFITMSCLGWRWTMYISSIMGFLAFVLIVLYVNETYAPAILVSKATILRQDEVGLDIHELITTNFSRPIRMLFIEPIDFLVKIYMSFIHGRIHALLDAYPIVFQETHGMNLGVGGQPFIGLIIGEKLVAKNNVPIPEWRLWPAVVGGIAFTMGLFYYTNNVHCMAPTASGVLVEFGVLCIFLQCFNYLIDSYIEFAASVFAANTILRFAIGGCSLLFSG
ncbi:major facilitator superfamily domain-containing protein [Rhexocercosporidium sp. MPI-PUGE-AT-0058]|nr:major facilitator superfamily domain-containing protein [Rhexocercosporidium sp. MPI-PUGE-AT-0058]